MYCTHVQYKKTNSLYTGNKVCSRIEDNAVSAPLFLEKILSLTSDLRTDVFAKTAQIPKPADYKCIFGGPLTYILLQHQTEVD